MDRSRPFAAFSDVYPERGHSRRSRSERDSVEFEGRARAGRHPFARTIRTFERPNLLVGSDRSFSMQFRPNLRLDLAVVILIQSSRRRMAHREGALQAGLIA